MTSQTAQPTTFAIQTHGCKLNQADALALAKQFADAGFRQVPDDAPADVYVVNTCTVTHVADRKARQALRAARRRNPNAAIVATGCYAQRSPEDLRRLDEIDLVIGNADKPTIVRRVVEWRGEPPVPCATGEPSDDASHPRAARTRAMVKIQEGCDQICAYCIVPKVRGRERSVPADAIIAEINRLHRAHAYNEVALTGTQLGSYGFEWQGASLTALIRRILDETDIPRVRVSSLQPQEITPDLLRLWQNPRLCPHFHIPLQSGSDPILSRMRRRYTAAQYAGAVQSVRAAIPHAGVTADVIVGFPGETQADFQATYSLCSRMALSDIHAFPYSIRPGTSAAHFGDQIPPDAKTDRMQAMLSLAEAQRVAFRRAQLSETRPTLWERREPAPQQEENAPAPQNAPAAIPPWSGLTDNYIRVTAQSPQNLMNAITPATLIALNGESVIARASAPATLQPAAKG